MNIVIVNHHSASLEKIESLLPHQPTIIDWDDFSANDVSEANLVILSGGSHIPPVQDYEEAYRTELDFLHNTSIPVIGICLGSELIARAFDANLTRLVKKRSGLFPISSTPIGRERLGLPETFDVFEGHHWAIESLPNHLFEIFARSEDGPELFRNVEKPMWGIQFHPERLTEESLGNEIFSRILNGFPLK